MPIDLATCPECGAAMPGDKAIEGSDTAIYPELSRANLLRMRGDYRGAEEQCLAILKRYPNNAAVHTLLGDIYAEQDDLDQAAQWYELAIDLNPASEGDKQKLAMVRDRQRQRESLNSAQSLGLPAAKPNVPLFATLSVAAVVLVGFLAYLIGQGVEAKRPKPEVVAPVEAPATRTETETPPLPSSSVPALKQDPQVDQELAALVSQRSSASGNLISVSTDPRSSIVTVTYSVTADSDAKRTGAELARTVLDQSPYALIVTLRAVRQGQIVYMADVPRSRYNEVQSGAASGASDSWIDQIITNEWPSAPAATNSPPPATTPPAATGATTEGTSPQQVTGNGGQGTGYR